MPELKSKKVIEKVTVIGLGVIGGSIGLALKKRAPHLQVTGVDLTREIIEEALQRGVVDYGTTDLAEGVEGADLVVLASPMPTIADICRQIAPFLKVGAIVTDAGSTKVNIVQLMARILPASVSFLGGHPMAGSEKTGLAGATELLFENAAYLLTPLADCSAETIDTVRQFVESLGAHVIILSPEEHDRKVAAVSHLPHVAACALTRTLGFLESKEGGYYPLTAGGFRDTTRIAASDSVMWTDILLQNSQAILPLINDLQQRLEEFKETLVSRNPERLGQLLTEARESRSQLPTGIKSILPELFELSVMVPDQPGSIAELTVLLSKQHINISDIEIMRVREENGGTIRLGFTGENQRDLAAKILREHGFGVR